MLTKIGKVDCPKLTDPSHFVARGLVELFLVEPQLRVISGANARVRVIFMSLDVDSAETALQIDDCLCAEMVLITGDADVVEMEIGFDDGDKVETVTGYELGAVGDSTYYGLCDDSVSGIALVFKSYLQVRSQNCCLRVCRSITIVTPP